MSSVTNSSFKYKLYDVGNIEAKPLPHHISKLMMCIEVRLLQPWKAVLLMNVTLSGIVTLVRLLQFQKV